MPKLEELFGEQWSADVAKEAMPDELPQADSHDLVPTQSALPTFLGFGSKSSIIGGLEEFSPAQLRLEPPRLRIIHKKERRDQLGEPGQLLLGQNAWDELDCVFVRAHPGRAYPEGKGKDTRIYCASSNNQVPHPSVVSPKDTECARCDYGQWITDGTGERHGPSCKEFIALLGIIPPELRPFWFICQSTAQKPATEFLCEVQKIREEGLSHISQLAVRITTEPKSKGGISWYVPIFSVTERLPRALYHAIAMEAKGLHYLPRLAVMADDLDAAAPDKITPPEDDLPF